MLVARPGWRRSAAARQTHPHHAKAQSLQARVHDISIAIDDFTRGLTVVTEPNGDHERLMAHVRTISFTNKHMNRAASWSGIGIDATRKGAFRFHLHDASPWEPDEELDDAIAAWTELHKRRGGDQHS